ncbi:MAG: phosphopantetheine-binding protein, partial [Leptospirales bacterium]
GRNPLDPVNREKRIHENPSRFNLTPDFSGSISKNRVFQRELITMFMDGNSLLFDEKLSPEELELARLVVTTLGMDLDPASIDPRMPLYGSGMGLDSIDILEISLAISKAYGFRLSSDDSDNTRIFSSLRTLNEHVQQHRTRD